MFVVERGTIDHKDNISDCTREILYKKDGKFFSLETNFWQLRYLNLDQMHEIDEFIKEIDLNEKYLESLMLYNIDSMEEYIEQRGDSIEEKETCQKNRIERRIRIHRYKFLHELR
jgi:hypothetical protein